MVIGIYILSTGQNHRSNTFVLFGTFLDLRTSNVRGARVVHAAHVRSQNCPKYCLRSLKQFLAHFPSFWTCACPTCAAHVLGMRRTRDHYIRFIQGLIHPHTDFQPIRAIF
jgi:hypothetical protein